MNKHKKKVLFLKGISIFIFMLFLLVSLVSFTIIKSIVSSSKLVTKELMYDNWFTENTFNIDEAPEYLKQATVAIEDERFYEHQGIDIKGLLRSVATNVIKGTKHGGSTINMQLSKMMLTTSDQTIERKIRDIYYALQIDKVLTKDEILEVYLNNMYLAKGPYGIKNAAKAYFNKNVKDLTLEECATLVGITKNPARYSKDMVALKDRRNTVLYKMYELGYITYREYIDAKNTDIYIVKK